MVSLPGDGVVFGEISEKSNIEMRFNEKKREKQRE